jgi:hypothetical protein
LSRTFWGYSDESTNNEAKQIWRVASKGHAVCQQVLLRLERLLAVKRLSWQANKNKEEIVDKSNQQNH